MQSLVHDPAQFKDIWREIIDFLPATEFFALMTAKINVWPGRSRL